MTKDATTKGTSSKDNEDQDRCKASCTKVNQGKVWCRQVNQGKDRSC